MLLFADAAALVIGWLRPELAARGWPVPVVAKVPSPRPEKFVIVQRHGGIRHTVVTDAAQLGLEFWAPSDAEAHDMAQTARGLLLYDLPGRVLDGHTVYRVDEFAGPANLPDPTSTQPRYVLELQVHIRGLAA